jgi:O-antigen/teichoic acid export membrane protein
MLLTILSKVLSNLVIFFVMARVLGVKEFGQFMYPFTLVNLLILLVDYGFSIRLVKEVSLAPENIKRIVSVAYKTKVVITSALFVIVELYLLLNHFDNDYVFLLNLLLVMATFNSFSQFFCLPFRGVNLFNIESKVTVLSNLLQFIIVVATLLLTKNINNIAISFLLSKFLFFMISYFTYKKRFGRSKEKVAFSELTKTMSIYFPYAIHIGIGALYFQFDTIIINFFVGSEGVGLYQAAMRIVVGALIITEVISNIYLPTLAKKFNTVDFKKMNKLSAVFGLLISVLLFILSGPITTILYGEGYEPVKSLLRIFSFLILIRYLGTGLGTLVSAKNLQKLRAISVVFVLIVNIVLNYMFIPHFGIYGAAIISVFTSLTLNLCYLVVITKKLKIRLSSFY